MNKNGDKKLLLFLGRIVSLSRFGKKELSGKQHMTNAIRTTVGALGLIGSPDRTESHFPGE